jgi:hypothetical protein
MNKEIYSFYCHVLKYREQPAIYQGKLAIISGQVIYGFIKTTKYYDEFLGTLYD